MPRLFILDAMGLAYRAYHAIRTKRRLEDGSTVWESLKNRDGEPTSVIHGFANTVLRIQREQDPEYWALAWDGPGRTDRHRIYPEYKANRPGMPEEMLAQIPVVERLSQALGLPVLQVPGQEADDVMATLAVRAAKDGFDVALVTSDKDMLPLVGERIRLWGPIGRTDEYVWTDRAAVEAKWGVPPEQIRDVLALMGDSVDNVPGVPGVGEKTAVELLRQFGSIDAMYERLAEVKRESLRRKLEEHREQLLLSRRLVTVNTDLDLSVTWDDLKRGDMRRNDVLEIANRYELTRIARLAMEPGPGDPGAARATGRMDRGEGGPARPASQGAAAGRAATESGMGDLFSSLEPPTATEAAAAATFVSGRQQATLDLWGPTDAESASSIAAITQRLHEVRARSMHGLALLPVAETADPRNARLAGIAIAALDGTRVYVPLAHADGPNLAPDRAHEWIAPMLADVATPKIGHDLKRDLHVLAAHGWALDGLDFDVHLGSFLLDPERGHGLDSLARDVLGIALPEAPDPRAARTPQALPVAAVSQRAEAAAAALVPLAEALRRQLEAREQDRLYRTLEHPLIPVLYDMEVAGIRLDRPVLQEMSANAGAEMARLEAELYALAGGPLNLNSGPQLAKVLFETLGLKPSRKTKTGYSTDQAVLEELAGSHAFPKHLLEYRALSKLKSTYLDALPQVVDPRDGRVHTTYHQAGAATGRLSSSDPNLQNIPIRSAQGREIRRAFVAAPGCILVGADYSQIELRVMAHLSGDPNLIEAFERGEDVHASTARRMFGVESDVLDPTLRARAKIVNFGIMYGMGARSLSAQMGIGLAEAQEFIKNYFRVFSRVRAFLDSTLEEARGRGYVQTLFGRRRYLPQLDGGGGAARAMAERIAVNTPIQGSAADLVKLAMERVHAALKRSIPSARLLLQVHDELLLECAADDAEAVATVVRSEMEGCFPLRVPLVVSVGRGPTWFDVH
jgi:DNA polymerase-1